MSTTKVSPFPPLAPPPPPPNPGNPSLTPFLPAPELEPWSRFIGSLGFQFGGSYPAPDGASALTPPLGGVVVLDVEVPGDEEDDEEGVEAIGGGLADKVTFVPSSKRSKACWTPSPPTSLPDPNSLPPLRASLSISSIWIIPILRSATWDYTDVLAYSVRLTSYSAAWSRRSTQFSTSSPTSDVSV